MAEGAGGRASFCHARGDPRVVCWPGERVYVPVADLCMQKRLLTCACTAQVNRTARPAKPHFWLTFEDGQQYRCPRLNQDANVLAKKGFGRHWLVVKPKVAGPSN